MVENKSFLSAFSSWKIWLALILGLGFAFYMLFSSLNETHFIETNKTEGTHLWKDFNKNKKIDFSIKEEFYPSKNGNYRIKTSSELISEINWTTKTFLCLGLAILFMFGRDLAYMWRIKTLTRNQISWKSSFYVIMLWEFASALAPGVASGSTVAMFILNREKIPLGKATAIVVITTMLDNLYFVLIIPCLFLFVSSSTLFPAQTTFDKSVTFLFWGGFVLFLILFLILFLSIFFFPQFVKHFLGFFFKLPFIRKWRNAAIQTGVEVEVASKEFKKESWGFWLKGFCATFLSWTSRFLVINCILTGFISINFQNQFFILAKQYVLWLLMRISPTPGGSGMAEYAFGELMVDFSQSAFLLACLAIIWRLIAYFPYLIIGVLVLPRWINKN